MPRYLIVDDNSEVRSVLENILRQSGGAEPPEIEDTGDASVAMELILSNCFDLILLDISLGEQSGLNVLKRSRLERPDLPVLIVSMHSESMYAGICHKFGAAGYLEKRHAMRELPVAVKEIMANGRYVSRHRSAKLP